MTNLTYTEDNIESLEKKKSILIKKQQKASLLKYIIPSISDSKLEHSIYKLIHSIQKQIDEVLIKIEGIQNGVTIIEDSKKQQYNENVIGMSDLPKGVLEKSKHISVHKLQESISTRSGKIYKIQGLFTDPEDYLKIGEGISRSRTNELTPFAIINPERIPDTFLARLSLIDIKEFKKLSAKEKLVKKKDLIKSLKNIFEQSITLTVNGDNKTTGRIQMINSTTEPSFGKIITFQTLRTLSPEDHSFYEKIALIFDDIYDCYRSQLHISDKLFNAEKQMQDVSKILSDLILIWKNEDVDLADKKEIIFKIINILKSFERFFIKKAIKTRLQKIEYKHTGNDQARLKGAKNDIDNAYFTIVSQRSNIDKQAKLLDFIIKQEEGKWQNIYRRFLKIINEFDQAEMIQCFDNSTNGKNLKLNDQDIKNFFGKGKNKKLLKDLENVLSSYELTEREKFRPNPFSSFHYEMKQLSIILKSAVNSNNFKEVSRLIFYLNILFKLQKYKLFLCKFENDLKLKNIDKNLMGCHSNELQDLKRSLYGIQFLKPIKYEENSKIHQTFLQIQKVTAKMQQLLKDNNYKELLKLLKKEKIKNL